MHTYMFVTISFSCYLHKYSVLSPLYIHKHKYLLHCVLIWFFLYVHIYSYSFRHWELIITYITTVALLSASQTRKVFSQLLKQHTPSGTYTLKSDSHIVLKHASFTYKQKQQLPEGSMMTRPVVWSDAGYTRKQRNPFVLLHNLSPAAETKRNLPVRSIVSVAVVIRTAWALKCPFQF